MEFITGVIVLLVVATAMIAIDKDIWFPSK